MHAPDGLAPCFLSVCWLYFSVFQTILPLRKPHRAKSKAGSSLFIPNWPKETTSVGSARVELLVTADGRVKEVKVLGGNPVLVQAVMVAVVKWKYEPAAEESSIVIKFDFSQ